MAIVTFAAEALAAALPDGAPVAEPLGEPVSRVALQAFSLMGAPGARAGVWKCSPGRWRRQVRQAEFCVFLAGEAEFQPDVGAMIRLGPGDAAYFPAGATGIWTVTAEARKAYIVFDEP